MSSSTLSKSRKRIGHLGTARPSMSHLNTRYGTDWKKEWFAIEDATYLNTAAHTVMPRVSINAVERSLEAKKFPHRVDDSLWFEPPVRIRGALAGMIGAQPEEIAVTTGASTGAAAVAHGLEWRP